MITYQPLKQTLLEKGLIMNYLRDNGLRGDVIASINRDEHVSLLQIERICVILGVPIEKVVQIIPEKE